MSPYGARRDKHATANAGFCDPRSFVSRPWFNDGTVHVYLKGADASAARTRTMERYKGKCALCGAVVGTSGEMDHILNGPTKRCWCENNLRWLCKPCHRERHVHVKWSRKNAQS